MSDQKSSQQQTQYPTEFIDLPSKGWFYDSENPLSNGRIELKYATAREEDILTSKNLIQKGLVIDAFIEALIANKSIDLDTMLLGDKNAIIIASRLMSYGPEYPVEINCPKCEYKNETVINISELETKGIDFDKYTKGSNLFEIKLPKSGALLKFKLLTQGDEKSIDSEIKGLKKLSKSKDSEITTRLRYAVVSVNGDSDRIKVKSFVENMLSFDSLAFRKKISECSPDVDMHFNFECSDCGYSERMVMPLGVNFFWPSGTV